LFGIVIPIIFIVSWLVLLIIKLPWDKFWTIIVIVAALILIVAVIGALTNALSEEFKKKSFG
jgi:CDP-diglyceride synthetase